MQELIAQAKNKQQSKDPSYVDEGDSLEEKIGQRALDSDEFSEEENSAADQAVKVGYKITDPPAPRQRAKWDTPQKQPDVVASQYVPTAQDIQKSHNNIYEPKKPSDANSDQAYSEDDEETGEEKKEAY